MNAAFYVEILKRLRDRMRRVRLNLDDGNEWPLHHDNAQLLNSAVIFSKFLTRHLITTLDHPPIHTRRLPHSISSGLKM